MQLVTDICNNSYRLVIVVVISDTESKDANLSNHENAVIRN
jgi:hypothetical protein